MRTTLVTLALAGIVVVASAQQPGFKRDILQQGDLSIKGHEAVTALVEFQPGATVAPHTHPGEEVAYVIEGTVEVEQAGKPSVTLGAGKTFLIPANTVHGATNTGSTQARVLATSIVEKGKPLATPAPAK